MGKYLLIMLMLLILGLLLGVFFGNLMTNYDIKKCKYIVPDNQYYEAEQDCYMTLERTEWARFWNIFVMVILSDCMIGIAAAFVYMIKEM